jgi:hypothetical protein
VEQATLQEKCRLASDEVIVWTIANKHWNLGFFQIARLVWRKH